MRKSFALIGIIGAVVFGTAAGVFAANRGSASPSVPVSGQAGYLCRLAYDVHEDSVTAAGGTIASATMNKGCPGAVTGHFTAFLSLSVSDFVGLNVSATCTSTGGFSDPCTVGQIVTPSPAGTITLINGSGTGTRGFNFLWAALKRGVWRFDVGTVSVGGNGTYGQRTWTVEAFKGTA